MLKKSLSAVLAFIMLISVFTFQASALNVGDPLGDVLYSDIVAYINGQAIPTSIKSGTTMGVYRSEFAEIEVALMQTITITVK